MKFVLLKHIKDQAREREINIKIIETALSDPEQIVPEPKGLKAAQNKFFEKGKEYIIRVVFREEKDLRVGITAYKTSKIKKYWRK
jgi:hypothetical protein